MQRPISPFPVKELFGSRQRDENENKPADVITPHSTEGLLNLILQRQQFIWPTFSAALHVWDHIVFLQVYLNYMLHNDKTIQNQTELG